MTTPNFGWPLIQPTDLVTDLPADFEAFADAVDADLDGLNGGTIGQVLTKASATDYDFAFATPAAPTVSHTWTLLSTTAMSGLNSITVSSITSEKLVLQIVDANHGASGQDLMVRPNNSTTASHYRATRIMPSGNATLLSRDQTIAFFGIGSTGTTSNIHMWFTLDNCHTTSTKMMTSLGGASAAGDMLITAGSFDDASAVTSITVLNSSGNFTAGTLNVYGAS